MADFLLSVGVDVGLSYEQMKKDISNLVSDLNKTPPKIKVAFDIDQKAVESLRNQITAINKQLGSASTNTSSGSTRRKATAEIADIANEARRAADTQAAASIKAANAEKEHETSLRQVLNTYRELLAAMRTNQNAQVASTYSELVKQADLFGSALEIAEDKAISIDAALKQVGLDGSTAIENAKTALAAFRVEMEQTGSSGTINMSQMYSVIAQMQNLLNSNGNAANLSSYTVLQEQVRLFTNALQLASSGSISLSEALKQVGLDGSTAIEGAKTAMSAFRAEVAGATFEEVKLSKGTEQYNAALNKVNTLLAAVRSNTEKWTAAKHGNSSKDYQIYSQQADALEKLSRELQNGEMSAREFNKKFSEIKATTVQSSTAIRVAGENTQKFSERIGSLSSKFGTWFSITRVIMAAFRSVKQMVSAVIELDTAMTELKKVTNETDATYEKFLVNAASRAKQLGAALSDTVTATADFARLGFSIEEAEKLADTAIVYKNVGDGIKDISEASESIIATMQAFDIAADDTMTIVDKFNEVGNNYAISSEGVGEALLRSAAAMHAANNSLDETIALATAANTIVQDPEKVGTTLKTVSMYLRAAKTEAEEAGEATDGMATSVSKLREDILALTNNKVDIQIDEDTFKSTYQILKELSEVWGELTDLTQANILEMVGGKRNSNVVAALLDNFSVAEEALKTSANSAGSALKENEKVLESIQGKINIMKASFETLSNNVISSDLVKVFIDAGTGILDFLNGVSKVITALGGLKTILLAVTSALLITKGGLIACKVQLLAVAAVKKIISFFGSLKSGITNVINILPTAVTAWKAYAAGTVSASAAMQASIPVIGLVLAALTALVGGLSLYNQKTDEARQAAIDTAEAYREQQSEMTSSKGTLDKISDRYAELSQGVDAFGNRISLSAEQYEEYKDIVGQIADMFPTMIKGYNEEGVAILSCKGNVEELTQAYNNLVKAQNNKVLGEALELLDDFKDKKKDFDESNFKGNEYTTKANDALKKILSSTDIEAAIDEYARAGTSNAVQIVQALKDAGLEQQTDGFLGLGGETGREFIARAIRENKEVVSGIVGNFDTEMAAAAQNMQSIVSAYISNAFLESYSNISPAVQNLVSNIVSGFDADFYSQFDSLNDLYNYLNNLLGSFGKLSTADANTLTATFDLKAKYDGGDCTIEEYINGIKNAKSVIDQFDEDTQKKIYLALGFDENDIEGQYDELLKKVEDKNKDWLNSLNSDDFSLVYEISLNNDTTSWTLDDWIKKLQESREEANKSNDSLSDLSKSLTSLKDAYSILTTAEEEMASGGLSADTIKALADSTSDYLDYLYEENGVVKLNTEAWKEYANAKMEENIRAIEASITELENEKAALEEQNEALQNAKVYADDYVGAIEPGAYRQSEYTAAVEANTSAMNENAAAIEANQAKLGIYKTLYGEIATSLDAYSAALNNFSNIANAITSVSNALTTVADLQETVANGFTISLEKALEFAKVYPEILNNATVAADGQITLNEGVVNAFISGKESELKAQIDAKIAELEADKSVLTAKMEFSKAQLELAKSVGTGEGQISKEVAEYRVNAGNAVVQAMIAAGIDEATAYQLACAAMAQNSEEFNRVAAEVCTDVQGNFNQAAYDAAQSIYKNMQNSKLSIASVAKQAHQAALAIAGIGSGKVQGSSNVNGEGAGGSSGSKGNITVSSGNFKGTSYSYESKTIALEDFISDLELDISNYTQAISQIDGQIAALKALRNTSLNKFSTNNKKASSGSKSGSKSGSGSGSKSSSKKDEENWFEKQYKMHNHLLDMDAENVEDYLNWLNGAYQQAYKENIITLDDFYKYQEEVYKGLRDLFKDYLNDVEHEISMRKNYDGESKKIISMYKTLISAVEKEIKAARAQGLDDTDDYIQSLQDKWASYKDAIKDIEDDIKDNAKDALEELVDYQEDMIKQDIENQKDAIDKKLDYLKEFYDKQKEMLQDQYDEEEYLKEQSEKRKSVSDIQAQLAQLESDDSAWAQKRKAELQKDLADAQGELDDFEKQHALDLALDALEDSYNAQEEQLQKQIDALDAELNNPEMMFNKALLAIQENTGNLYQQMLEYNRKYGTGNDDDVKDTYEEAYKALLEYKELYGKDYKGVKLTNATGYKPNTGWDTSAVSGTNPSNQSQKPPSNSSSSKPSTSQSNAPSLSKGSSITVKKTATHFSSKSRGVRMASFVPGGTYTVYQTKGNEVLIGRNGVYTGWINKSDIVGYATGTKKATAGLHSIDELGTETTFESKDGVRYKLFTGGEKVLNAKASDFLYEFANGGGEILKKIIRSALGGSLLDTIQPVIRQNEINMGDIIVRGNADQQTVSAIRREQRSAVETMLKEFNKLNK